MTRYISLAEYLWLAEQVTRTPARTLATSSSSTSRTQLCLAWNHPLLDGNKRAAWAALILFVDLNGGAWDPDPPSVDEAEQAMLAVAARELDEAGFGTWLQQHVRFASTDL